MNETPHFGLSKWYADCISAEGDAFIGYSARLRYRGLSVRYSSVLSGAGSLHSLGRSTVDVSDHGLEWSAPALDVNGRWQRAETGFREIVYESPEGAVEWDCIVPRGEAAIERASHPGVRGWGYAEHLRLTIAPWRLPIRRLRWGRFLSDRNTLIWIDWEGDFRTRIVYRNGRRVAASAVGNEGLTLEDGTHAEFDRGLVLRQGKLGSTVLDAIPGLERAAPSRIFLMDECKWLSRATLECAGGEPDHGWCIHEEVTWP
jgi:hypothetical protein